MTGLIRDILLVEDNEGDVLLIRNAFQPFQDRVSLHTAEGGEAALLFLRRQPPYSTVPIPDLILLDMNLPRMDGRELLQTLKADAVLRRIPTMVLSSSEAPADIMFAYENHAALY